MKAYSVSVIAYSFTQSHVRIEAYSIKREYKEGNLIKKSILIQKDS